MQGSGCSLLICVQTAAWQEMEKSLYIPALGMRQPKKVLPGISRAQDQRFLWEMPGLQDQWRMAGMPAMPEMW
jgi:hypothetical protein